MSRASVSYRRVIIQSLDSKHLFGLKTTKVKIPFQIFKKLDGDGLERRSELNNLNPIFPDLERYKFTWCRANSVSYHRIIIQTPIWCQNNQS